MTKSLVISVLFLVSSLILTSCNPLDHRDTFGNKIWRKTKCQTKPLSMRYFSFTGFNDMVIEVIENKRFNQAIYFRHSVDDCHHFFAIPLQFSVRDLACTKETCVVLKDIIDDVLLEKETNVYFQSMFKLVGGFIQWLKLRKEQRLLCSQPSGKAFNYTDSYSAYSGTGPSVIDKNIPVICSVSMVRFDDLSNYFDMTEDYLLEIGLTVLGNYYDEFNKIADSDAWTLKKRSMSWINWSRLSGVPEKYLCLGEALNNGRIAMITSTNKVNHFKALFPASTESFQVLATSITSFNTNRKENPDVTNFIYITLENMIAYAIIKGGEQTVSQADGLYRVYARNETVYAIGNDFTTYYSETLIPNLLSNYGICQAGSLYFNGIGCVTVFRYHDELYDKDKICEDVASTVRQSSWPDQRAWTQFSRFDGKHSYFVGPWKSTRDEARQYCTGLNAELATVLSKQTLIEISKFLKEKIEAAPHDYEIQGSSDLAFWISPFKNLQECYNLSDKGRSYRGTLSTTASGRVCQNWQHQSPHTHTRYPGNYPTAGLGEGNKCRNPDGENSPWCYTTDPSVRWEYCDLPVCKDCCDVPDADRVPCASDVITQENAEAMGCCFNHASSPIVYMPKRPEECVSDYQFLSQTTLVKENGETIEVPQQLMTYTSLRCLAVVYNPTLGVNFAHKIYDCAMKFNFVCQRDPTFFTVHEHQYVEPNVQPIEVVCNKDTKVTYSVPFGCRNDVSCTIPGSVAMSGLPMDQSMSRPNYNWTFTLSNSMGLPKVGDKVSESCTSSTKILAEEDCSIRLSHQRVKCHHWHDNIGKQECIAHGCCWDDFVKVDSGTIQCFKRRDAGYIEGPNRLRGRKTGKVACKATRMLAACDYKTCAPNARCENDPDNYHVNIICHCDEGYTGDGSVSCIPLQACREGWKHIASSETCIQTTLADTFARPEIPYNNYYYSTIKCNKMGAGLLTDRTLLKVADYREISDALGLSDTGSYLLYHLRAIPSAPVPRCLTRQECHAAEVFTTPYWDTCYIGVYNSDPIARAPCWGGFYAACETQTGPLYLYVRLASQAVDEHSFGYEKIWLIPGPEFAVKVTKDLYSCALLQTYDFMGDRIYEISVCNEDTPSNAQSVIETFFSDKVPQAYYFGVVIGPRFKYEKTEIESSLQDMGIEVESTNDTTLNRIEKTISGVSYVEADNESLVSCRSKKAVFSNGVKWLGSAIHIVNGTWQCQIYFDGQPDEEPEIEVVVFEQTGNVITRRLEVVEPINTDQHVLHCPHYSTHSKGLAVNAGISNRADGLSISGFCKDFPCVIQLVCHGFMPQGADDYQSKNQLGYQLFCRRFHNNVVTCPISKRTTITDDLSIAEAYIPRPNVKPVYLNMDELLNLGAPSIPYSSVYDRDKPFVWRPLEWEIVHEKYPHMVSIGVRDRAIRFSGQEVRTHGEPCWGYLGLEHCKHGTTVSLWISITRFPTSSHLRIIDTGVWDMADECGGLSIYVDPVHHYMHVAVVTDGKMWHLEIPTKRQRWVHLLTGWSETGGLYANMNLGELIESAESYQGVPQIFKGNISDSISKIACEKAMLRIGNFQGKGYRDGTFEIDEVYIFPEALHQDIAYSITGLRYGAPIRHEFDETSLLTNGKYIPNHDGAEEIFAEAANVNPTSNGVVVEYNDTCMGSSIRCFHGFTLGLWIHIANETELERSFHSKDIVIGNLPFNTITDVSFGYKITLLSQQPDSDYKLVIRANMDDSLSTGPLSLEEHSIEKGDNFIILQMSKDGIWRFCYELPTSCKKIGTSNINPRSLPDNMKNFKDPYTRLFIGPTLSGQMDLFTVRAKVVEEDMDLVKAFDFFNNVSDPTYFPLFDGVLSSTDDLLEFQIKGSSSQVFMDNFASLRMNARTVAPQTSGWLQISENDMSAFPCLENISSCLDGFTIQFGMSRRYCNSSDEFSSSGVCIHVSNMPYLRPYLAGFAVYSVTGSENIRIVIQTSEHKVEAQLEWPESQFAVLRLTWHPVHGLTIFIDDILRSRIAPKQNPTIVTEFGRASLAIGCSSNDNRSCSEMLIQHLYYWNVAVHGKSTSELEHSCGPSTVQAGESCFTASPDIKTFDEATQYCHEKGGYLGNIATFAQFFAYDVMRHNNNKLGHYYWTGLAKLPSTELIWNNLGISPNETGFLQLYSYDIQPYTNVFKLHHALIHTVTTDAEWALCDIPLVSDPFYYGCVFAHELDMSKAHTLELVGEADSNAYGTYNLPRICMRECASKYGSLTVGVGQRTCVCFESEYKIIDGQIARTDPWRCKAAIAGGKMSLGYAGYQDDNILHKKHCGPIQLAGAQKCNGTWSGPEWLLSVYTRAHIETKVTSRLTAMTYFIMNENWQSTSNFFIYDTVAVAVRTITCMVDVEYPASESQVDDSCTGITFDIHFDFGDGITKEAKGLTLNETKELRIFHYYTTSGDYETKMKLTSVPDGDNVEKELKIRLMYKPEKIILSHLSIPFGEPGEFVKLSLTAISGDLMACYWYFIQGKSPERVKVDALPHPVVNYKFDDPGYYRVTVWCYNRISSTHTVSYAAIDSPVDMLEADDNVVLDYKTEVYKHNWKVFGGSNIICKVFVGNTSIPEMKPNKKSTSNFTFDASKRRGTAFLSKNLYHQEGKEFVPATYVISVMCYNSATDPVPIALTYLIVEEEIKGLHMEFVDDKKFLLPNEEMTILVTIQQGKNVQLLWDFDDDPEKNFVEICGDDECANRKARIKFPNAGVYNITVTASNALSTLEQCITIQVEAPVTAMTMQAFDVAMIYQPVDIVVTITSSSVLIPTNGIIDLKYSGAEESDQQVLSFDEETRSMELQHRFKSIGIYNIYACISNNVSDLNVSTTVQVGRNISGLRISVASSRYLRTNEDPVEIHVTVNEGSEITYEILYGDETQTLSDPYVFYENVTRRDSTVTDFNILKHYYREPGNYTCTVTAENIYGKEEKSLDFKIIVQNPVNQEVLLNLSSVDTVAYPPGNVILNASLVFAEGKSGVLSDTSLNGYANDVDMSAYLGNSLLREKHGTHEIDVFPINITLSKAEVGDVRISVVLQNLVSSANYHYDFIMSEKIEGIVTQAKTLSIGGVIKRLSDNNFTAYIATEGAINLYVSTIKGSHVRYNFSFGDDTPNTIKESTTLYGSERFVQTVHSYKNPGIYDIGILAENDISAANLTLAQSVRVYHQLSKVAFIHSYVKNEDFNSENDDPEKLGFEDIASVIKFRGEKYMPTNKTLVLTAYITSGSNATFTWTVVEAGIMVTETDNGFTVFNLTDHTLLWSSNKSFEMDGIVINMNNFVRSDLKSTIFVKFMRVSKYTLSIKVSNAIGFRENKVEFYTEEEVSGPKFQEVEPPLANFTTNITFSIDQIGSNSCVVLNWGDGERPISFGFHQDFCETDERIADTDYIHLMKNINGTFEAYETWVTTLWQPVPEHETGQSIGFYVTVSHNYVHESVYVARLSIFNRVSTSFVLQDMVVIKILCDYPTVHIDKQPTNSLNKPREVLKSLAFKLYSTTKTRCFISSETATTWSIYQMIAGQDPMNSKEKATFYAQLDDRQKSIHDYILLTYVAEEFYYRYVPGFMYTSKSDTVRIPPRFLNHGLHLLCLNVAMVGVYGISTTDCIYVKVNPTPLVAAVLNGNARTVGHDEVISITTYGASYDPDVTSPTMNDGNILGENLYYMWSTLFLANSTAGDFRAGATKEELEFIFAEKQEPSEISVCVDNAVSLECQSKMLQIEVLNLTMFNSTSGEDCKDGDPGCYAEELLNRLRILCKENNTCSIKSNIFWLDENEDLSSGFEMFGSGIAENTIPTDKPSEPLFDCFTLAYLCRMPDEYDYFNPTKPCLSGGYFTEQQDFEIGTTAVTLANDTNTTTCHSLTINADGLKKNSSYIIFVKASHPPTGRLAFSYQILDVTEGAPPSLRINCIINCKGRINSFKLLSLKAACTTCRNDDPIRYEWEILKWSAANGSFTSLDDFVNLTTTGNTLPAFVIKPKSLAPGGKYRFRVTAKLDGFLPGMTTKDVLMNLPPVGGNCDITPKSGNCLNETFTIWCSGWKDEGVNSDSGEEDDSVTLKYEIWYQKQTREAPYLLSSGNNAVTADKYLAPGSSDEDYRVTLYVHIVDEFGDKASVTLTAKVFEDSNSVDGILQNITAATISSSGSQATSQFSQMAGELLNSQASKEKNKTDGEDLKKHKEDRTKMRSDLIKAVTQKTSYENNLEGVQQASSALKSLAAAPDEVGNDTQVEVVNALSDMTSSLKGIATSEAPEEIEEAASNLVGALDLVVDAARDQFIRNAATKDGVPQYTLPPPSTESGKVILDEEEEYLSPEERLEYRKQKEEQNRIIHAANREQAKTVGSSAVGSVNSLSSTLMSQKQAGEPSVKLKGKDMTVDIERKTAKTLCENTDNQPSKGFKLPCGSDILAGLSEDETVDIEFIVAEKNPYIWDDSADAINSAVISLNLNLPNDRKINSTNSSNPFRIEVPTKKTKYKDPEQHTFDPSGVDDMSYHEIVLLKEEDVMFLTVAPEIDANIRLYFELADNLTTFPNVENNSLLIDVKEAADNPDKPNRIRLDINNLGTTGRFVFGIHEIDTNGNVIHHSNMTWQNYTLHTVATSCRYWNEKSQKWSTDGCSVSSETTEDVVVCLCDHLTSFGADFFVAPNPIDFSVIAKNIANLANNLAVLLALIGILVLFIAGIIYLRREDKKDIEKWSVAPLLDNKLIHTYFYQLMVKTGKSGNAGTKSKIHFTLSGQNDDTTVRSLSTRDDMVFRAGGVTKVIMSTEQPLGKLNYLRIWHDNSGSGDWASWFLDAILITDLQTNEKFYFLCDDWLAVDQSDGAIDRLIMVADKDEIKSFKILFQASTSQNFSDGHLWFSMFSRPTKSNFTRIQRLACAVTLLFCTMLASAMFYGRGDSTSKHGKLEIGPISFSVQQLMISIQSSLVVAPINILIVQMFRKLAPNKSGKHYVSRTTKSTLSTATLRNVIENEENDENSEATDGKKKSDGFKFPHWCLYIAWFLVIVTSLGCAGVVFLYSIMWGSQKSNDWLISIVLSFIQSVFVIQPAKVIFMALAFSLIVKRLKTSKANEAVDAVMQAEEEDDNDLQQLQVKLESQEEWLLRFPDDDELGPGTLPSAIYKKVITDSQQQFAIRNSNDLREFMMSYGPFTDESSRTKMLPPEPEAIEVARNVMAKRTRMIATAYEIVTYLLYVTLILVASNSAKDPKAFRFHQSLAKVFVDGGDLPFSDVRTIDDFFEWSRTSFIDGLFAQNWYNGKRVKWSESRFIANRESFVVGPARLRQIRSVDDECIPPESARKLVKKCVPKYDFANEETKNFLPFWIRDYSLNETEKKTPWMYQNFLELEGFPYEGKLNIYGGGGYAAVLGNTAKRSRSILKELEDNQWVDHYTRAIFVEFTVYNANINLFGTLVLLFERSENGAFEPLAKIYPLRLFEFIDGKGAVLIGVYLVFLATLIYSWYRIIKAMKKQKCKYLKEFWNGLDFLSALLSLILIAIYAVRYIQSQYILGKLSNDPDKETFLNFQFITLWNDTFRNMAAFVVFFSIVKFVRLLRFNTRIQMLTHTLRVSAVPLLYFAAMFALYFCSFLFLSWLWFEQKIYAFSTILLAAEEMLVMMLGRFDFTELQNADRMLGPIFFTSFTFCCTIALVNMFVVILDESIKKAKARNENVANEFELVDFVKKKAKEVVMSHLPSVLQRSRKENYKAKTKEPTFASPEYIHYPHEVLSKRIDTIAAMVDDLEKFWMPKERLPTVAELEAELANVEMVDSFSNIRDF